MQILPLHQYVFSFFLFLISLYIIFFALTLDPNYRIESTLTKWQLTFSRLYINTRILTLQIR